MFLSKSTLNGLYISKTRKNFKKKHRRCPALSGKTKPLINILFMVLNM